jgi:hypothetical protein
MSAWSSERLQQILLDPIDDGAGIHMQQTAQIMGRVDAFDRRFFHVFSNRWEQECLT